MGFSPHPVTHRQAGIAFTLIEVLVSMAVLVLLLTLVTQLFNGILAVTTQRGKHMDADAQARAVFDRMSIDFGQILRRGDIDYFLKDPVNLMAGGGSIAQNDQCAFYSQVPGYFASTATPSPLSLVAYRINSDPNSPYYNELERLGYGLVWNGVSANDMSLVFSAHPTSSLPNTLSANWPNATATGSDAVHSEAIGPQVFRMEYYYLLRGQTLPSAAGFSTLAAQASATPWWTGTSAPFTDHMTVNGLQDVAAMVMVIAVIDPASRLQAQNSQLVALAGQMQDFAGGMKPGDLENQWQTAVTTAVSGGAISKNAGAAVQIYRRAFYLPQN